MILLGIGIDLVEVDRIKSSYERFGDQFLSRIFTEKEREYCLAQKRPEIHLAARFAAKEAISKAFGVGIGKDMCWQDLEISRGASGLPGVILTGKAQQLAKVRAVDQVMVSLTHTPKYAAANAVIMGCGPSA